MIPDEERCSSSGPIYICGTEGKYLWVLRVTGQLNPFWSKRDPQMDPQLELSVLCWQNTGADLWIGPRLSKGTVVVRLNPSPLFPFMTTFLRDLGMHHRLQEPAGLVHTDSAILRELFHLSVP